MRRSSEQSAKKNQKEKEAWHLPPFGQRILKTGIAVFICLVIYALRGYEGQEMRAEAAIAAIICMQPYVSSTRHYAVNRITGSLIGAGWGLLLLLLLYNYPVLGEQKIILYILMSVGVMLSLYTSVVFHKTESSALAAIIFLWLVITYPDVDEPFLRTLNRLLDLLTGILATVLVNSFRLPRTRNGEYLFFVRAKDLVPDRFSQLSPTAMFRLNSLYRDGARICLISEHAPAFFALQMSAAHPNVPIIVMDGAAIFQMSENTYLHMETIPPEDSAAVMSQLDAQSVSYFIYTIHNDRTRIFHHGEMREEERVIYQRMRRSPYRDYFEGEIYHPDEIVSLKIIVRNDKIDELESRILPLLPAEGIRWQRRKQAGSPDLCALYIYSARATVENAREYVTGLLRENDPGLVPMDIHPRHSYRTEYDALYMLHTIERLYEPVGIPIFKRNRST